MLTARNRTFYQLAAERLTRVDLNRDLMALEHLPSAIKGVRKRMNLDHVRMVAEGTYSCLVEELDRDADGGCHGGGASLPVRVWYASYLRDFVVLTVTKVERRRLLCRDISQAISNALFCRFGGGAS